jgi:hypothetical protein
LKPTQRAGLLLLLIAAFVLPVCAQESAPAPSLGDLARQERERKLKQSAQADTDASEPAGLTPANFKANILINESKAETEKWVLMPEAARAGAGRIRQVTTDKKYYLPFVVTGYTWPATEKMSLTARVRFISPVGKIIYASAKWSETIAPDPKSPSVIVLNPVMDITFDHNDVPGTYTIRIMITDHVHSTYAKAEEKLQLIQGTSAEGKAAQKPAPAAKPDPQ